MRCTSPATPPPPSEPVTSLDCTLQKRTTRQKRQFLNQDQAKAGHRRFERTTSDTDTLRPLRTSYLCDHSFYFTILFPSCANVAAINTKFRLELGSPTTRRVVSHLCKHARFTRVLSHYAQHQA